MGPYKCECMMLVAGQNLSVLSKGCLREIDGWVKRVIHLVSKESSTELHRV